MVKSFIIMQNLYVFYESNAAATVYGVGTYIKELTESLINSDINVCVLYLRSEKSDMEIEEKDGIQHWYIPNPINKQTSINWDTYNELYYRNVVYLLQLRLKKKDELIFQLNYFHSKPLVDSLKKMFECKIVLVVHYLDSIMTLYGNISRFRRIISQVDELTDKEEKSAKEYFLKEKELFHFQGVDKIVCLSNHTFDLIHQDYHIDQEKMSVIPNGLADTFQLTLSNKRILRKKWHISENEFIILFVGRLQVAKGLFFLIDAFRKILEMKPNCRLIITGNGNFGSFIQTTKTISTRINFTGFLEKNEVKELYQIADIGVLPSLTEQCSYVAIEMMMHSLPMITSSAYSLAEMTEDGISSLQTPIIEYYSHVDISSELLADKILYLIHHSEERKQIGVNARMCYEEKYSSIIFRKNMIKLYNSLYYSQNNSNL